MGSAAQWFHFAIRLCVVVVLTPALMLGISVGSLRLAGWEFSGLGWLALGLSCLPTLIACFWYLIELRNVKKALMRGILLGLAASMVLLIGLVLLFNVGGSMDGGNDGLGDQPHAVDQSGSA